MTDSRFLIANNIHYSRLNKKRMQLKAQGSLLKADS